MRFFWIPLLLLAALPAPAVIAIKFPKPANADVYRAKPDCCGYEHNEIWWVGGRGRRAQAAPHPHKVPLTGRFEKRTRK